MNNNKFATKYSPMSMKQSEGVKFAENPNPNNSNFNNEMNHCNQGYIASSNWKNYKPSSSLLTA